MRGVAGVFAVAAGAAALVLGPVWALSAAVAWVALTVALARPHRTGPAIVSAGAGSLAGTAGVVWSAAGGSGLIALSLVEVAALLIGVMLAVRRLSSWPASVVVFPAVVGVGGWVLRDGSPLSMTTLTGAAVWAMVAVVAAATGGYLRLLDLQRAQAVRAGRREQRVELAGELHDFVAHDVSGILALAQAGQLLPDQDDRTTRVLRAIEAAAHSALSSMDRAIGLLHDDGVPAGPTVEDLPALLDRFEAAHPATIRCDVDPDVPKTVSGTAYRVVVEALTNIRRHAPGATRVDVVVRVADRAVTIAVRDAGGPTPTRARRPGGTGIASLTERVHLLGGTVEAGRDPAVGVAPGSAAGWCLRATLPLALAKSAP